MNKTKLWTKDYILLLLTTFFAAVTHNIFTAVFPLYVIDIGGDTALVGTMISGLTIATIITRLLTGFLSDTFGRRTLLILGSTLFAINTIAYIFVTDLTGIFILRICNGISQGIYFSAAAISVAHIVDESRLVDGIGYFGIAGSIAAAVAPMFGLQIFNNYGINVLLLIVSISASIGISFTVLMKKEDQVETNQNTKKVSKPTISLSALFDFSIIIPAIIYFFVMFGNSSVINFLTTFGVQRQIANISLFFLINNIAMIIIRVFNSRLLEKFGFNTLLLVGGILLVGAYGSIAIARNLMIIILAAIAAGVGMGICVPLLNTIIFSISLPERKGVVSSTFALMGDVGNGVGAFSWGYVSEYGNYTLTYLLSGVCILLGIGIHLFLLIPKMKKQKVKF